MMYVKLYEVVRPTWPVLAREKVHIIIIIIIIIIITIIIICQTANPTSKANSYKPEGTSREGSPVRKGKDRKRKDK